MTLLVLHIVVKSSCILTVAAAINIVVLRRASAAWRHLVWTLAATSLLVLPILSITLPSWNVPIHVATPTTPVATPIARVTHSALLSDATPAAEPAIVSTTEIATPHATSASSAEIITTRTAPALSIDSASSWLAALPLLYVVGVLLVLSRLIVGRWTVGRLARRATPPNDPAWAPLLAECRRTIGVRRPVRLLRSLDSAMPMAFGVLRPAILMPPVSDTWSDDRRRAVLLHELAHVARHDCLTQLIAAVTCALYWMHPGVWWVARRLRVERELASDDRVLAIGAHARDYAGHLLDLAYMLRGSRAPALTVSMARRGQIEGRLLAVLDAARSRAIPAFGSRVAGVVIAAGLVMPLAAADPTLVPVAVVAGQATARPAQSASAPADITETRLPGTWEIRPSSISGVVNLRLNERQNSSSGFTIAIEKLDGLSSAMLSGASGAVSFRLHRDAGMFVFDGRFRAGIGAGTYSFTPSATFPGDLARRGFARPSSADQYALAKADIGFAFLDELDAQKYARPDLVQLVRAAEHGVDFDDLRGMGQAGYHLGHLEALIAQRDHGVDPSYVRGLAAQGLTGLSADDLMRARDHGIDPPYIGEMKALGYTPLSLDALVDARDHGIDPAYVRDLRQLGYGLTRAELVTARDHGIDAEYIRAMGGLGYAHLSLDALVDARDHGIDPVYVQDLRQLGYQLTLVELVDARDHGIDPKFIRGLNAAGYQAVSLDDLVRLRDHGMTPEYARAQNDLKHTHLTVDDLITLRDGASGSAPTMADSIRAALDRLRDIVNQWMKTAASK